MQDKLQEELDHLIMLLERPLPPFELANGWTPQCQAAILSLLQSIRDSVRNNGKLPEVNIGRGLDHWGVEGGSLFEKACAISNHLRDFYRC